jgi:hypothetical protein
MVAFGCLAVTIENLFPLPNHFYCFDNGQPPNFADAVMSAFAGRL